MNEISLLVVVLLPDPVDMLVPSGTMLQVIVAGAPLPDLVPEAVVSHGSGSLGLMINPLAEVTVKTTQNRASNDMCADSRRMMNSGLPPAEGTEPQVQ
jgi:hypothetical protein